MHWSHNNQGSATLMYRKRLIGVSAGLALVFAVTACGQQAQQTGADGDISITFSNIAETTTLDPAVITSSDGYVVIRNVYDSLTAYELDGVGVEPSIATEWSASDDATEYTFTIREGITFQDGSDLTAEDVVQSVMRVKEINQGPASYLAGVSEVTALDDFTVQFTLSSADLFLPGKLQKISIVSGDAIEANATDDDPWATAWFADNAVGSGPYKFDVWNKGRSIELSAFEDYYLPFEEGTPTKVTLRTDADVQTALQLMGNGEIDAMGALGPDDSLAASQMNGVKLIEQDALCMKVMPINVRNEALSDVRVREAVSLAFDYQAMIDFYQGFATPAVGPLPTSFGYGIENLPIKERDVDRAKQLLADAGYADGLELTFMGLSGLSYQEFAGTLLVDNLDEIGITVTQNMLNWPQMPPTQADPATAADISFLDMCATTDDPSTMLKRLYLSNEIASNNGFNWSYLEDPEVDAAINAISSISDETARAEAVLDAVNLINGVYPAIYATQPSIAQPVLEGWDLKYEAMDAVYSIRFFFAKKTS